MIIFYIIFYLICAGIVWFIIEMFKTGKVLVDYSVKNPVVRLILYVPLAVVTIICLAIMVVVILI